MTAAIYKCPCCGRRYRILDREHLEGRLIGNLCPRDGFPLDWLRRTR